MSINVSTNKDGQTSLYANPDFCISTDTIHWKELVLKATDTEVICFGILSAECRGVSSFKDKDWKPEGKKVTYRVYSKEKEQWDKNTSKYIVAAVNKDEALLYKMLSAKAMEFGEKILVGNVTPWVNPFIYELDATDVVNLPMIQKLSNQCVQLDLHPEPHELTQSEINALQESTGTKKGTYSKSETEAERLQARYTFLCSHFEEVFDDCTSLADLGSQIAAAAENAGQLAPDKLLQNSVEKTIELLKIVMGGK